MEPGKKNKINQNGLVQHGTEQYNSLSITGTKRLGTVSAQYAQSSLAAAQSLSTSAWPLFGNA